MFKKTESLLEVLREKSAADLEDLMGLSKKIAESHVERFKAFERLPPKQALLLLGGKALGAQDFDDSDQKYVQSHMRIVSGLYGVLRPYDDVRGVRDVPMGAKLETSKSEDLYDFWGESISKQIAKDFAAATNGSQTGVILGCMNEDYWKAIDRDLLPKGLKVWRVKFAGAEKKEIRDAYGLLARYMVRSRVSDITALKQFDRDGWTYESSSDSEFVFARRGGKLARARSDSEGSGKKKKKARSDGSDDSGKRKKKSKGGDGGKSKRRRGSSESEAKSGSPTRRKGRRKQEDDRSGSPRKRKRNKSPSESPEPRRKKGDDRDARKKKARARSGSS
jgi:cytoplasmic iron level regulating protein YaaA (DUF328/UPF0246 family)